MLTCEGGRGRCGEVQGSNEAVSDRVRVREPQGRLWLTLALAQAQAGRGIPKLGRGKVGAAEDRRLSFLRVAQWEQHPIYPLLAGGQVQLPGQRGGARDDL